MNISLERTGDAARAVPVFRQPPSSFGLLGVQEEGKEGLPRAGTLNTSVLFASVVGLRCFDVLPLSLQSTRLGVVLEGRSIHRSVVLGDRFGPHHCGFVVAFGTMAWFGLRRAFGVQASGLVQSGPYRLSRNPQILGGYLLVLGVALQSPSLYSLGWIILYGIIGHMMIVTEEEYLAREYGTAYERYAEEVPRYLRFF